MKKGEEIKKRDAEGDDEEDALVEKSKSMVGPGPPPPPPPVNKHTPDISVQTKGLDDPTTGTIDVSPPPPTQIQKSINAMYAAGKELLKDPPPPPKRDDNTAGTIKAVKAVLSVHGVPYDPPPDAGDRFTEGSETEQTRKFNSGEDESGYEFPEITTADMSPEPMTDYEKRMLRRKKKAAADANKVEEEGATGKKAAEPQAKEAKEEAKKAEEEEAVEVLPGTATSPCHNGLEGC